MVRKGSSVQVRMGAPWGRIVGAWRRSSVGQSSGIIIRVSEVRVLSPLLGIRIMFERAPWSPFAAGYQAKQWSEGV
jgi:hypothetical protein